MQSKYLSAEERRQRTVEAVVALAGTQNPSDITTAAIASEMSVTQGALFRHFPSKDAIWQAVMEWVADRLLDRIDRAAEQSDSPLAALHAIFMSHIEFVIEHPGVPRMMFGELQRAESTPAKKVAHTLMKRYAERLVHKLEEAKADGEILNDTDTQAAAILLIGMIQGLVMQSMLAGNLRAAKVNAPAVIEIYCRGLSARHAHRTSQASKEPRQSRKKA